MSSLLSCISQLEAPAVFVSRLVSLGPEVLRNLTAAVGLGSLKEALGSWEAHESSSNEEFWQKTLTEHSFVLGHVFPWPVCIVKGKAYVGGKSMLNTGGGVVDFLVKNSLTNNVALVEIKTPSTPLIAGLYRDGAHSPSAELSGSIVQVLGYRASLQQEFLALRNGMPGDLESFEPRCVVIIGNTTEIRGDPSKLRSFELYRNHTGNVTVVTFDELFEKTRALVSVLESPDQP